MSEYVTNAVAHAFEDVSTFVCDAMDMAERTRSQRAQEGVRVARSYDPYDQMSPNIGNSIGTTRSTPTESFDYTRLASRLADVMI